MLKNTKISKEDIINASFEIVKKEGMDGLNVRKIAEKLNSSVQPIYYQFGSIEELKKVLWEKAAATYQSYMNSNLNEGNPYKMMGINYIRFAKEEPVLFQLLFLSETSKTPEQIMTNDAAFDDVCQYAKVATGLEEKDVKKYHLRMWMFTHGLACLVATRTCTFTDEEINQLLIDEYQALNLLEKERKEKHD